MQPNAPCSGLYMASEMVFDYIAPLIVVVTEQLFTLDALEHSAAVYIERVV